MIYWEIDFNQYSVAKFVQLKLNLNMYTIHLSNLTTHGNIIVFKLTDHSMRDKRDIHLVDMLKHSF